MVSCHGTVLQWLASMFYQSTRDISMSNLHVLPYADYMLIRLTLYSKLPIGMHNCLSGLVHSRC